jgi:septal ring factor EnvC (AmiA/AmiB activator)
MKNDVLNALNKKKQEDGQMQQMDQQIQQMDQQLKEATQQAQKLEAEVKRLNEAKLQMENEKLDFEKELEWFKAKDDSAYKESSLELEKKRVELEGIQLLDDNKNNDEIKND